MDPPHALLLPYPAQGHVIPLLELAHCLANLGFIITFVNTEFNHDRILAALSNEGSQTDQIHLVSIPDGLEPGDDRNDLGKLTDSYEKFMPGCLEQLIRDNNERGVQKITSVIADQNMGWAFHVAEKMNLRSAAFFPASAGVLAVFLSIPKLIEDGIIDPDGVITKKEIIRLSPDMLPMNPAHFVWNCFGNPTTGQIMFHSMANNTRATETTKFIICNSFYQLEPSVFAHNPRILPIGPLPLGHRFREAVGQFWPEDTGCSAWLDKQPANSVVYVAFGSFTVLYKKQFQELALGLELTGMRFLWVVRPDLAAGDDEDDAYPVGFRDRVVGRGNMVGWSPQQKVLAHPAIACFVTHCGWNSTMEGVRNGVRFLCWPYFADQFFNESYICDVWRTGLRLDRDESGVVSKEEIRSKVEELIGDEGVKERAMALKEMAERSVESTGSSFVNFCRFSDAMS